MLEEFTRIQKLADRFAAKPNPFWRFESSQSVTDKAEKFLLWKISCGSEKKDASTLLIDFLTRFLIYMRSEECGKLDFPSFYAKGLKSWYHEQN